MFNNVAEKQLTTYELNTVVKQIVTHMNISTTFALDYNYYNS